MDETSNERLRAVITQSVDILCDIKTSPIWRISVVACGLAKAAMDFPPGYMEQPEPSAEDRIISVVDATLEPMSDGDRLDFVSNLITKLEQKASDLRSDIEREAV